MRPIGQNTLAHLANEGDVRARLLFDVRGFDTTTSAFTSIRLWTGEADRVFAIDGQQLLFKAVGGAITLEPIEYAIGLDARRQRVVLSALDDSLETLFRNLRLHFAPAAIYRVLLAPEVALDGPETLLTGRIDEVAIQTGAEGQGGRIELTIASSAMELQRPLDRCWSDAAQQQRAPDAGAIYVITSATWFLPYTTTLSTGDSYVSLILNGGSGGGQGIDADGTVHEGQPGAATVAVVKDAAGNVLGTWTAAGGAPGMAGSTFATGRIFGVGGGSVEVTGGAGGAGGVGNAQSGSAGADGTVHLETGVQQQPGAPDRFFKYAAVAGAVNIRWA